MPKSSKRFILSDESLNSKGFFIVTAGIDLTDFKKNPIMYWMHIYPTETNQTNQSENPLLPIGYWADFQISNNQLSAIPVFDDSDEFAMKIYNKVEHGTIRAASVAIEPVELDTNKANWKPGQKLPTYLKSKIAEASIVDRGSNKNAVTLSFSSNECYQTLSDKIIPKPADKKTTLTAEDRELMGLSKLIALAKNTGKINTDQVAFMLNQVVENKQIDAVKDIIRFGKIEETNLDDKYKHGFYKQYLNLSYDQIENKLSGGMRQLSEGWPEMYQMKFFEKFGRMPAVLVK